MRARVRCVCLCVWGGCIRFAVVRLEVLLGARVRCLCVCVVRGCVSEMGVCVCVCVFCVRVRCVCESV